MSELSEFINHVFTQIVVGVVEAQKNVETLSAKGNPTGLNISESGKEVVLKTNDANLATFVEFDINLVAESTNTGEGGLNLSILKFGASAKLADSDKQTNSHKIKFRVPVLLPSHEITIRLSDRRE